MGIGWLLVSGVVGYYLGKASGAGEMIAAANGMAGLGQITVAEPCPQWGYGCVRSGARS